jgi:anti-sigma regulatory factor (Ser/Thr protein kinase)
MSGSTSAHCPNAPSGSVHAAGGGTGARDETDAHLPGHGDPRALVPPSHHGHDLARWPLRNAISLGALEGAVPSARVHVRQLLWEWGCADLEQDAGVVVSELVTNAIMASAELRPAVAPVLVWLGSDTRCVLVAVADASPRPPMRLDLEPDAEGGRGLALVEAFSSRWGWHATTMAGLVKVVWAEWRLSSGAGQPPATDQPDCCRAV